MILGGQNYMLWAQNVKQHYRETCSIVDFYHIKEKRLLRSTKGRKVRLCRVRVHVCAESQWKWGSDSEKKHARASSIAALKKLLLNTKRRLQDDEHPACSFHIKEIAFGNIELAGMMKHTTPLPCSQMCIFMVAHISNTEKIIFTRVKAALAHRMHTRDLI